MRPVYRRAFPSDRRPVTPIHLAADQNDVFLPALAALLVATLLVVVPVVLAPAVRRARNGRVAVVVIAVLAVAALVVAAWQAGIGVRTLQSERARVGAELASEYGYHLDPEQVGALVDGDRISVDGSSLRLRRGEDRPLELLVGGRVRAPRTQA